MTPEMRSQIADARLQNYHAIIRTVMFANVILIAVIQMGPNGYSAPMTMFSVALAAYGILAGGSSLDDVMALREDMDEKMAATAFGKALKARNTGMLKTISSVLLGLVCVAELYSIWT